MATCVNCGYANTPVGKRSCYNCGRPLEEDGATSVVGSSVPAPAVNPAAFASDAKPVKNTTFKSVWYLPEENRWRDMQLTAMRDRGVLVVSDHGAEFTGSRERVVVADVKRVSFGKQGRDFVNNWVRIDYGDGRTAFFADGSSLGWGGVLGGTRRILDAVLPLQNLAPAPTLAPIAPVWTPTHRVPPGGMPAWDVPDGSRPPVSQLPGDLELVLETSAGDWSQVRAANGWRGWVDGRQLTPTSVA